MNLRMFIMALGQAGAPTLAAATLPRQVNGSAGNVRFEVGQASCQATGGTPPYTYRWYRTVGNSQVEIKAGTTTDQLAVFESSATNDAVFAYFKCVATDAATTSAESSDQVQVGAIHGTVS